MAKTVRIIASPGLTSQRIRLYADQDGALVATSEVIAAASGSPLNYQQTIVVAAGEYFATIADSADADNVDHWGYVTITADDPATFDIRGVKAADLPALQTTALEIVEDTSTTLPAQIAGISSGAGLTGPNTRTITVTDSVSGDPIENAKVRLYRTGESGTQETNASGVVTFTVVSATWSYAITATNYTGVTGTIVVSANGDTPIQLALSVVSPPDDPALCAVTIPIVNQHGVALVGETVEIRFNEFDDTATTTTLVLSPPPTQTSDSSGYVSVNLLRLASYSVFYGTSPYQRRVDIDVPDAASFTVGE